MSRLEELIREKCPDGVEYLSLLSVANVLYGYPCDALLFNTKNNGKPLARIRDVLSGMSDTYTTEIVPKKYELTNGDLLVGMDGNFHVAKWKTDGGILCQRVCKIYSKDEDNVVINGYLSHILGPIIKKIEDNKPSGTVKHLLDKDIKSIEIPVPPIEVQQEIVRILDKFTELEAESQAELAARKKQYEYYRDRLFVFKNNVEYKNILNVISMKARVGWQALTKKEYLTTGEYYLITGTDFREDGCIEFDSCVYVSEERYDMDDNIKVHVNDILMTKDGTLGKVAFMEQEPPKSATLNGGVYRLTVKAEEVLPKYIYHYFTSYEFKCFIEKVKTGGTIKHLTQKWFETLEIPVPPIKKQEEIVRILDTFSAFCNSRVSGLPAEIQARHKQYEYYRDKLLTFKRKEV